MSVGWSSSCFIKKRSFVRQVALARALFVAHFFVIPSLLFSAVSADTLLQLSEQQAETVSTFESMLDTTIESDRGVKAFKVHMLVDKTQGLMKVQYQDASGTAGPEILLQGTDAYVRMGGKPWTKLPMDEQTKAGLQAMGADFGGTGLAGLDKVEAVEPSTAAPTLEVAATAVSATAEAADPVRLLKRRGWSKARLDKAQRRMSHRMGRRKQHEAAEREVALDKPEKGQRGVRTRHLDKDRPWDEQVSLIDEQTGVVLEHREFIRAGAWPGGKSKAPRKAVRMKALLEGKAGLSEDSEPAEDELVELSHSRVLKTQTIGDITVPQESESVSNDSEGGLRTRTRFVGTKLNHKIDAREFDAPKRSSK